MAGVLKKTTNLTGLAVSKYPHRLLTHLYNKTLRALENIPKESAYRQHTEKVINERLDLVSSEQDVTKLEEKINSGQVEELILQADRELDLARRMISWKAWEPLENKAPVNQWKWPM